MSTGFVPAVGEKAWQERDIRTDAELRGALADRAAAALEQRRAERLAESAAAAALQEQIAAAVTAGEYEEAERLKERKDELVEQEAAEAAAVAAREAPTKALLERAVRTAVLPLRWLLLSEVWAFYLLAAAFAYGVLSGAIGPTLAWRGGLVLAFVAIVTWVSRHTLETPDRAVFLDEWREQTGRGPGGGGDSGGGGAAALGEGGARAAAKGPGPKKND
jgi:uncharacterized membrane protein YgcG